MKCLINSLRPAGSSSKLKIASLALLGTAALFCLAAATSPDSDQGDGTSQAPVLIGSWQVTVTPSDGSPSFPSLLTYGSGGVLTGADGGVPPSQVTSAHGAWTHKSGHTFGFTFVELFFDPAGVFTVRISETLTFESGGHAYNGVWTGETLDPAGNVVAEFGGTSHAERILVAK